MQDTFGQVRMCRRDCHLAQLKCRISHRRTVSDGNISDTIRPYDRGARGDDAILERRPLRFQAYQSFNQSRSCVCYQKAYWSTLGMSDDNGGTNDV